MHGHRTGSKNVTVGEKGVVKRIGSIQFLGRGARRHTEHFLVLGVVFVIRSYQAIIRPFLIGTCKFCPTCSEYGIEALRVHGLWRGATLTLRRVLRCHPFSAGGIDPVPEPVARGRRQTTE